MRQNLLARTGCLSLTSGWSADTKCLWLLLLQEVSRAQVDLVTPPCSQPTALPQAHANLMSLWSSLLFSSFPPSLPTSQTLSLFPNLPPSHSPFLPRSFLNVKPMSSTVLEILQVQQLLGVTDQSTCMAVSPPAWWILWLGCGNIGKGTDPRM